MEMIKPQNCAELADLLLEVPKGQDVKQLAKTVLKRDLFNGIMDSVGDPMAIHLKIRHTFCSICANNVESDAHLVADVIKAWVLAYPHSGDVVVEGIISEASSYIHSAGEGLAIGLLEVGIRSGNGILTPTLLNALKVGPILSAMTTSNQTPAGSGRLTTVIHEWATLVWLKSLVGRIRRAQVSQLLTRWHEVLDKYAEIPKERDKLIDQFWVFSSPGDATFLEKLANELSTKFFINAPLGVKFHLNELLEKNLPDQLVSDLVDQT